MSKILLAADGFLTEKVLTDALRRELDSFELSTIVSDWPTTPFGDVGEVHEALGDEDTLIDALAGVQVCFTHTWPFTDKVFEACPALDMVTVCRGGPVNVDVESATKHGVVVSYTPGRNATATAEHTVAMLLAAARQIPERDSEIRNGKWRSDYYRYDLVGPEIKGSTVGIIGYGAVGSRVGHILAAMGAKLVIFDPWVSLSGLPEGAEIVGSLEELFRRSNMVTIHARSTPDNYHMINRGLIDLMPKDSILVNCARGPLLDYDAACDALDSGHLYAAAFDCLPEEPLPPGHRLLTSERVVMTPHLGGASKQAAEFAATVGAKDIAAFLRGDAPKNCINPSVLSDH